MRKELKIFRDYLVLNIPKYIAIVSIVMLMYRFIFSKSVSTGYIMSTIFVAFVGFLSYWFLSKRYFDKLIEEDAVSTIESILKELDSLDD